LEVTSFTFMALWLAQLGATVSASHQIAANFTSLIYMLGLSIATATTNLTARELGAGRYSEAHAFSKTGLKLATLCAVLVSIAVLLASAHIATLYSDKTVITEATAPLLLLVACYHLFDVGQTVCSFILRAYRVVQPTVWVFLICLWGIGLGLGYHLTFGSLATQLFGDRSFGLSLPLARVLQTTPFGFWIGSLIGVLCANMALFILLQRVMKRPRQ
jgi:multidrug resistance protein, MATE family